MKVTRDVNQPLKARRGPGTVMRAALVVVFVATSTGPLSMVPAAAAAPSATSRSSATPATTITAFPSTPTVHLGAGLEIRGWVIAPDALPSVVVQRFLATGWSDRAFGTVDQQKGAFSVPIMPSQSGTYTLRVRSGDGTIVSNTVVVTVLRPIIQIVTYSIQTKGGPATDLTAFKHHVAATLADARGWSLGGSIDFRAVSSGGNFTLVLAAASSVPTFGPPCDARWSCRSGRYVIINDLRWRQGAPGWSRSLDEYRHYVANHEVGHWLGLGHLACPGAGAPAPVMMQQSIHTSPCVNTVWPLVSERAHVARLRGVTAP